jgi:CRP/FNR family transcriptional regulator
VKNCVSCKHRHLCLVEPLLETKFYSDFKDAITDEYTVEEEQHIFQQGDESDSLYLLKSGSIKLVMDMPNGSKSVLGFGFSWKILGLTGVGIKSHSYSATALEKVRVCKLDYQKISELMFLYPDFHKKFLAIAMSQLIESTHYKLISSGSVERRTAAFLYSLVLHNKRNGLVSSEVYLPMPRVDISDFLDVSVESLSRGLSALARRCVITVHNRKVSIFDSEKLRTIAQGMMEEPVLPIPIPILPMPDGGKITLSQVELFTLDITV